MRLFVDVNYHGQMDDMNRDEYVTFVGDVAATIGDVAGQDWNVSRVGTAPFRQVWPAKAWEAA